MSVYDWLCEAYEATDPTRLLESPLAAYLLTDLLEPLGENGPAVVAEIVRLARDPDTAAILSREKPHQEPEEFDHGKG
jgi:hypothetical protein